MQHLMFKVPSNTSTFCFLLWHFLSILLWQRSTTSGSIWTCKEAIITTMALGMMVNCIGTSNCRDTVIQGAMTVQCLGKSSCQGIQIPDIFQGSEVTCSSSIKGFVHVCQQAIFSTLALKCIN